MIVYHGTGRCSLKGLLTSPPKCWPRDYLRGRSAFSTTTDRSIAELFALRRSPPSVLGGDEREMGVVLEYRLEESGKGRDWMPAVCSGVLQDEQEIAVLNPSVLELAAVWEVKRGRWKRSRRVG